METLDYYKGVLSGEMNKFPKNFWQYEKAYDKAAICIKYLFNDILHWSDKEIKEEVSMQVFKDFKLHGMMDSLFRCSPYLALECAFPKKFKAWELKSTIRYYWDIDTAIEAVKWLIEEKLKWSDKKIRNDICVNTFKEYGLFGMLLQIFNASPSYAICITYPNRFRISQMRYTPVEFYTKENGIKEVKWLIEEKLKWSDEDIKKNLCVKTFKDNYLYNILSNIYDYSPFKAIDSVYPGRFKEWELRQVPRGFWTLKTAKEAIKWLIDEKLKWSDEQVINLISIQVFKDFKLYTILKKFFDLSPYKAIVFALPERFAIDDFSKRIK